MLATLGGFLALLLGLTILLLPLLVTELSRPRDSVWGAVVLLLGLVLVTTSERLTGAPMLAVLCGGLLVGRLTSEVAQGRWRALTDEERLALRSAERWRRSLDQLGAIAASLLQSAAGLLSAFSAWQAERRQGRSHGKRWVRSETAGASGEEAGGEGAAAASQAPGGEPPVQADGEVPPQGVPGGASSPEASAEAAGDGMAEPAAPPSPAAVAPPSMPLAGSGAEPEGAAVGTSPQSDPSTASPSPAGEQAEVSPEPEAEAPLAPGAEPGAPGVRVVSDFHEIEALLDAALPETVPEPVSEPPPPGTGSAPSPEG